MKRKINMKSNSGFTMVDLIIALTMFTVFTGIIGATLYSAYKTNIQTQIIGESVNYAMLILEDIDKISYEEVRNGMESAYMSKFSIPSGYDLKIEVTNYNQGNNKEDLVKTVRLTIDYEFLGQTESFNVSKLKVKEL